MGLYIESSTNMGVDISNTDIDNLHCIDFIIQHKEEIDAIGAKHNVFTSIERYDVGMCVDFVIHNTKPKVTHIYAGDMFNMADLICTEPREGFAERAEAFLKELGAHPTLKFIETMGYSDIKDRFFVRSK